MQLTRIIDPPDAIIRQKFTVTLTAEERSDLTRLISAGRHAARALTHAGVLLQTDAGPDGPGWTDAQMRDALGVSERTVARIRRAFVDEGLDAALHPARAPCPSRASWTGAPRRT